jgi:hypothetical protein
VPAACCGGCSSEDDGSGEDGVRATRLSSFIRVLASCASGSLHTSWWDVVG